MLILFLFDGLSFQLSSGALLGITFITFSTETLCFFRILFAPLRRLSYPVWRFDKRIANPETYKTPSKDETYAEEDLLRSREPRKDRLLLAWLRGLI